jgi:putative membrane protein
MLIAGLILAALAGAFHVFIFVLESVRWTQPATRRIFGVRSEADAETMKQLAFNQGFYNPFLALAAFLGVVLVISGFSTAGMTLALAGTGTMLAAALVLVIADLSKLRAAVMQGALPLLAVVALALGWA